MKHSLIAALAVLTPGAAGAQSYSCAIPDAIPPVHADLPSASEPRRILPIGGYTLALTWAPQYCHDHARDHTARFQCGGDNRFGFTLHGLWPDGIGPDWPQYCRSTALLPRTLIAGRLCTTPSAQLIQHEWAKHGTCTGMTPVDYFDRSTRLYARVRYPDMKALSKRRLSVGAFVAAMAGTNQGLTAGMIRVTATRKGWLDELWLCLDRRLAFTPCRANSGGLPASASLKIWRGDS